MAEFTASAKQFTMDGGIVYEFKDDEDYKTAKKDLSHLKKAMASNWVEQPRQRKMRINYNEAVRHLGCMRYMIVLWEFPLFLPIRV